MAKLNVEQLRKELEFITGNRRQWHQNSWMYVPVDEEVGDCGTIGCLAGWTVAHAGYEVVLDDDVVHKTVSTDEGSREVPYLAADHVVLADGSVTSVGEAARQILGLSLGQSELLFEASKTLHELWQYARFWSHGAIEIPPDVEILNTTTVFSADNV